MNPDTDKEAVKKMGKGNIVNADDEKRNGAFNPGVINKNVLDGQYFDSNNTVDKVEIQLDEDLENESNPKGGSNQMEKTPLDYHNKKGKYIPPEFFKLLASHLIN